MPSRNPFVACALLAVLLLSAVAQAAASASEDHETAPSFSAVTTGGQAVSLQSIHAGKPFAVLTFFGVSCIPCQKKLVQLNEMWRDPAFRDRASLYAVNADGYNATRLSEELARRDLKIDFPVIADDNQAITNLYVNGVVPLTVVIDNQYRLVMSLVGARPESSRKMKSRILSEEEAIKK